MSPLKILLIWYSVNFCWLLLKYVPENDLIKDIYMCTAVLLFIAFKNSILSFKIILLALHAFWKLLLWKYTHLLLDIALLLIQTPNRVCHSKMYYFRSCFTIDMLTFNILIKVILIRFYLKNWPPLS